MLEDLDWDEASADRISDPVEIGARESLREFFDRNRQRVYFRDSWKFKMKIGIFIG